MPYDYLPFLNKDSEAWWRKQPTERMAKELSLADESLMFAKHEVQRLSELSRFLRYEITERQRRAAYLKSRADKEAQIRDSLKAAAEIQFHRDQFVDSSMDQYPDTEPVIKLPADLYERNGALHRLRSDQE